MHTGSRVRMPPGTGHRLAGGDGMAALLVIEPPDTPVVPSYAMSRDTTMWDPDAPGWWIGRLPSAGKRSHTENEPSV